MFPLDFATDGDLGASLRTGESVYSEGSWNGALVGVVVVFGSRVEASRLQCSVRDGLSIDQSIGLRHLGARAISDGH